MTPFELDLLIENYCERMKYEQEEKITLAYMTALWTVQWQSKNKPKPLNEILGIEEEKKEMTDEEMLKQVKILNKLFGGEVK